jgi:genome maintenance exonuclease 1
MSNTFTRNEFNPLYDLQTKDVTGMRFYQTPNGIFLPSVTTVINYGEKPWLDEWRNMLGKKKADKEQQRCADRGTAVHLMCERFLKNETPNQICDGQTRENIKLFNQIKFALKGHVDNIRLQENAMWSEVLGIAGRCDLVADYDGTLSIIDFKTSNKLKDEGKIEHYFTQCAAYALMVEELYGLQVNNVVVIITTEAGLMPQVFKQPVSKYVSLLQQSINKFYSKEQSTIRRINQL